MSVMWWLELLQLMSLSSRLSHTGAVQPQAAAAAAAQLSPARLLEQPPSGRISSWQDKNTAPPEATSTNACGAETNPNTEQQDFPHDKAALGEDGGRILTLSANQRVEDVNIILVTAVTILTNFIILHHYPSLGTSLDPLTSGPPNNV